MRVFLWLDKLSKPIKFHEAESTYEKGAFFCIKHRYVFHEEGKVTDTLTVSKFPVANIFRVLEDYE